MKKGKIKNSKLVDLRFKAKNLLVANKVAQIERQEAAEAKSLPNRFVRAVNNYIEAYEKLVEAYDAYFGWIETNGHGESFSNWLETYGLGKPMSHELRRVVMADKGEHGSMVMADEDKRELSKLKDFDNRTNQTDAVRYYKKFDETALQAISNIAEAIRDYNDYLIKQTTNTTISPENFEEQVDFGIQRDTAIRALITLYPEKEIRTFEEASKELKDVMVESRLILPDKKGLTRAKK